MLAINNIISTRKLFYEKNGHETVNEMSFITSIEQNKRNLVNSNQRSP